MVYDKLSSNITLFELSTHKLCFLFSNKYHSDVRGNCNEMDFHVIRGDCRDYFNKPKMVLSIM